jgi:hypothetical protein
MLSGGKEWGVLDRHWQWGTDRDAYALKGWDPHTEPTFTCEGLTVASQPLIPT